MTTTVTIDNPVSTSDLLVAQKITFSKEESTDKKISDIASTALQQQDPMKTNLILKNQTLILSNQDLILQNQHKLFIEVKKLKEQLEKKKGTIPPPPLPPPLFSPSNWKKNSIKNAKEKQIENEAANHSMVPTETQIQEKLGTLRKSVKNKKNEVNFTPQDNVALKPKPVLSIESTLRQTQSLCVKNTQEENSEVKGDISVATRIKQFKDLSQKPN